VHRVREVVGGIRGHDDITRACARTHTHTHTQMAGGNIDWFGVGHADAMLPYFERYLAIQNIGHEIEGILDPARRGFRSWRAEMFLEWYMKDVFNVSLLADERIAAGLVKPTYSGQSVP